MLDTDLAELFGIDRELQKINYIKQLNSPTPISFTAIWLTKTKAYSMEKLRLF